MSDCSKITYPDAGKVRAVEDAKKPLLFLDVVSHFGGSKKVTVALAANIKNSQPVIFVDAYGNCKEYMAALSEANLPVRILEPATTKGVIGSKGFLRIFRMVAEMPMMMRLVRNFRQLVKELSPKIIIVNCDKALFIAKRAIGSAVPIVMYAMGNQKVFRWYVANDWAKLDMVIGISKSVFTSLRLWKKTAAKTVVVYNGIDDNGVRRLAKEPVSELPGMNKTMKLLFPASIDISKAQHVAIEAVCEYKKRGSNDVQLWLSGSPPRGAGQGYISQIAEMIEKFGLQDNVAFLGWQKNIIAVMGESDIAILTSTSEGMPCCLIEAMALGKPVIATNVGGIPELVRNGIDGILVEKNDVKGICEAMIKLSDPAVRTRMGQEGQKRVSELFTLRKQVADFMKYIHEVENSAGAK